MVEEADAFELIEEETETEATGSTTCWETTASEDDEQVPVEKQLTFLVFESACSLPHVYLAAVPLFPSSDMLLDLF